MDECADHPSVGVAEILYGVTKAWQEVVNLRAGGSLSSRLFKAIKTVSKGLILGNHNYSGFQICFERFCTHTWNSFAEMCIVSSVS